MSSPGFINTIKLLLLPSFVKYDVDDVMCQTWIWYWVYFRVVRHSPPREIAEHVINKIEEKTSLGHIHQFNCFLADLYKVGFLMRETQSQTDIGKLLK